MTFISINEAFMNSIRGLSVAWNAQVTEANDPKVREVGVSVIQPVSETCKRVLDQTSELERTLQQLEAAGLIWGR